MFFSSDTTVTMVFLPGDHVLNTNITVANIARLTMHGESFSGNGPTVVCSGSVGLKFASMMDFRISFLTFTSCSRNFGTSLLTKYSLLLDLIDYVELDNCSYCKYFSFSMHPTSGATCTMLNYTVSSLSYSVHLHLYADGPCSTFCDELVLDLNINQTCPSGLAYLTWCAHVSVSQCSQSIQTSAK